MRSKVMPHVKVHRRRAGSENAPKSLDLFQEGGQTGFGKINDFVLLCGAEFSSVLIEEVSQLKKANETDSDEPEALLEHVADPARVLEEDLGECRRARVAAVQFSNDCFSGRKDIQN